MALALPLTKDKDENKDDVAMCVLCLPSWLVLNLFVISI